MVAYSKYVMLLIFVLIIGRMSSLAQVFSPYELSMVQFVESLSSVGDYNYFSKESKNEIDSAIIWLNSVENDPRMEKYAVWFLYNRGRLLLVQKQVDKSRKDLEKAIELDSMDYYVMERICVLSAHYKTYTNRKHYIKKGIKGYEHKLKSDSLKATDWYFYAQFLDLQSQYSSTHNIVKQRYAMQKCVSLDSTNANFWYELSLCYYTFPQLRLNYLEKALKIRESTLFRDHVIAVLSQGFKDNQRSVDYIAFCLDLYKSKYPENKSYIKHLYTWRADIYKEMGKLKERSEDLKMSKTLD